MLKEPRHLKPDDCRTLGISCHLTYDELPPQQQLLLGPYAPSLDPLSASSGGLHAVDSRVHVTRSRFRGNVGQRGGGLYADSSTVPI